VRSTPRAIGSRGTPFNVGQTMKPAILSIISVVLSWGLFVAGLALYQLITIGRLADVGVTAIWSALAIAISWLGLIWPIVTKRDGHLLVSDLRWSWLGWSLAGVTAFSVLFVPLFGVSVLPAIWAPALIGAVAGLLYSLLRRNTRAFRPNKPVEVTPTAVTPAASAPGAPSAGAPHH